MNYVSEGTELYKIDNKKIWVASFQYPEDCQAVADSLNSKNNLQQETLHEELEPVLC